MTRHCVIFDMDGTLADTVPLCLAAFQKAIKALSGQDISDEAITATFGPAEDATVRAFLPNRMEEGLRAYWEHYDALHDALAPAPFDGVCDLLHDLKSAGATLALVTGKGIGSLSITLERYDMLDTFDAIETGKPDRPSKPEGIRAALDTLGIRAEDAVYIGDMPGDIDAARQTGVFPIAAAWAATADADALTACSPGALCLSVGELRTLLLDANG